jgi:hypothetical protein
MTLRCMATDAGISCDDVARLCDTRGVKGAPSG